MSWLVCALLGVMATSPTPAEVRKSAASVLDSSYQSQLPHQNAEGSDRSLSGGAGKDLRNWRPPEGQPRERRERERMSVPAGGALSAIANALLWVLLGVAVVLIVLMLVRELGDYTREETVEVADAAANDGGPDQAVVSVPLGDAEELARQGRYREAIHTLLLRTLEELTRRLSERLPRSLTSREILARVAVPDEARQALAELVSAVEVTHFGSHDPSASEYHACRERFHRFAEAYTRGQM